jgi:hypothetical protein
VRRRTTTARSGVRGRVHAFEHARRRTCIERVCCAVGVGYSSRAAAPGCSLDWVMSGVREVELRAGHGGGGKSRGGAPTTLASWAAERSSRGEQEAAGIMRLAATRRRSLGVRV